MPKPTYVPAQVIALFNDMARTYGAVNLISSFGFSHLWRKRCVDHLALQPGQQCADLMCGMGEAATLMMQAVESGLQIEAVDFSEGMTNRCREAVARFPRGQVAVQMKNVFELPAQPSFDRICCSFGLKTFDDQQMRQFAALVGKLLKSAGRAAFVEIYVPAHLLIRIPFLFYLRHIIPLIGLLCLGNPDCYRCLALYTEDHAGRDFFGAYLRDEGFTVKEELLFWGCAKLYIAQKSEAESWT